MTMSEQGTRERAAFEFAHLRGGWPLEQAWYAYLVETGRGPEHGKSKMQAQSAPSGEAARRITHCERCGGSWYDDGLNPVYCPYCEINRLKGRKGKNVTDHAPTCAIRTSRDGWDADCTCKGG